VKTLGENPEMTRPAKIGASEPEKMNWSALTA
jgi:hypothetical protein